MVRIDEKNLHEYYVFNLCGVVITTNHKTDGIYLPADDRRHMVAWSNLTKDDFAADYWRKLYGWYANGGNEHVAAYLAKLDISGFDPKAPPPKTQAFWEIANANRAPEDAELADVLDDLGRPDVVTLSRSGEPCGHASARLRRMAARPQKPPQHPAPFRGLWLRRRLKPERHRGTLEDRGHPPHDLWQGYASPCTTASPPPSNLPGAR